MSANAQRTRPSDMGTTGVALALRVVERNIMVLRRSLPVFMAAFLEPALFLASIGFGVGAFIDGVDFAGRTLSYEQFMAPALVAVTAMNGAVFETTFNFFVKLRYMGTYDAILATPVSPLEVAMGELTFTVMRGVVYAGGFLIAMALVGLTPSWWALGVLPLAAAVAFGFGGIGLAASTYMRSFVDFDKVWVAIIPLFLFSGTFFPLDRYPTWAATAVRLGPLHHGVQASRLLVLGEPSWMLVLHFGYFIVMGSVGLRVAARRIGLLLTP